MKKRIFWNSVKLFIYLNVTIILFVFLLLGLLYIAEYLSENGVLYGFIKLDVERGKDISVYVIAAATLEFAVLSMLQQHITRQQDRALEFPDMCIERCELITSPEKLIDEVIGNSTMKGEYLIKTIFSRTFPVYYMPKVHRAWVRQRKYQTGENDILNKMKVQSSHFRNDQGKAVWDIQIDKQQCISDTVKRTQVGNVQSLELVYDVSWENQLLPWINRLLSKLYMRMVIRLEDAGVRNAEGCSIYVRNLEIKKASILAPQRLA